MNLPVLGAHLHVVERVAQIGVAHLVEPQRLGAVGLDDDEGDALGLVVRHQLLHSRFVDLGGGAVDGREHHDQHGALGKARQRVGLAVHARQREVRRLGANGERSRHVGGPRSRDKRDGHTGQQERTHSDGSNSGHGRWFLLLGGWSQY